MTETMKAQLCQKWLAYCLSIGWQKKDLKVLCDVFWKYDGWRTFKQRVR